ncbi:MAG: class I SAM-dependent methyltransferase [Planctomycetota bacterium]
MDWYRFAEAYDIWFSWDPDAERRFLLEASRNYGINQPRRLFEPMCGPGRLLRHMPGWAVGLDLEPAMTRVAARTNPVVRADAAAPPFRSGAFDLAFNLIDSFRHLPDEASAARHLRGVARTLRPGAVYVLGLEVNGHLAPDLRCDEWQGEQNGRHVRGSVEGVGDLDADARTETMRIRFEVDGAAHEFFHVMRTYTPRQLEDLIDDESSFELAAVFPGRYSLEDPIEISELAGSALLVLRREPT